MTVGTLNALSCILYDSRWPDFISETIGVSATGWIGPALFRPNTYAHALQLTKENASHLDQAKEI